MFVRLGLWVVAVMLVATPAGALGATPKPKPKARPDLSVASLVVSGSNRPGEHLTAVARVRVSGAAAPASRTIFLVSADAARSVHDAQLASVATGRLKVAKDGRTVTAKVQLPVGMTGAFHLIACADGASKVAERSERNNCRASARRLVAAGGGEPTSGAPNPPTSTKPGATTTPPASTPAAEPELTVSAARTAVEGDAGTANALEWDVSLSAASAAPVSFTWATSTAGTAESNDYVASSGTVTLNPGQLQFTVQVLVTGDTRAEDDESVRIVLSQPVGATVAGTSPFAWILDDEAATVGVDSAAGTQTSVALVFSSAPTNLAADGSQFTIGDLAVIGASRTGNVVTLTTAPQIANLDYTITIASSLRAGARSVPATAPFLGLGPVAQLIITEVNANIDGNDDLVELRAVTGGSIVGAAVDSYAYTAGGARTVLPSMAVHAGDYLLVHHGSPIGITTELDSPDECIATDCRAGAWDVVDNSHLTMTSKVLTVVDGNGHVTDGIPLRETAATASNPTALANLQGLQDDTQWVMCAGGFYCTTEGQYDSVAVNWSGTGTTAAGQSVRRLGADTNSAADWSLGASSWGSSN